MLRTESAIASRLRLCAVVLGAAFAFWLTLTASLAGVFRAGSPAVALGWSPNDAEAMARQAALVMAGEPSEQDIALSREAARDVLRRAPLSVEAVRVLGLIAEAGGDGRSASRYFMTAQRISRRDQQVQLWLILQYSRRGDVASVVRHLDIALRTSNRNWGGLLPLMVNLSADPRMLPHLSGLLQTRPPWRLTLLQQLVQAGTPLEHVVVLSRGRLNPADPEERAAIQALLDRLVTASRYDLAWQVYAEARGAGARAPALPGIRDGDFEAAEPGFAPFDWTLVDNADLGVRRENRAESRGSTVLAIFARNGRSGEVARQLVRLAPDTYQLQMVTGGIPVDVFGRPIVRIACVGGEEAPLLELRSSTPHAEPRGLAGRFSVPSDCPWLWLTIRLMGESPEGNGPPWIDNLAVHRVVS